MSDLSSYSLSDDNYLLNKELSLDFNFDEKGFKFLDKSPNTIFSTTTSACK